MKWPDYQGVQIFHMITYHWDHSHKYYTGVAYNICAVTKCVGYTYFQISWLTQVLLCKNLWNDDCSIRVCTSLPTWLQGTANINKGLGTILYPVGCTLQSDGCGFALLVQGREIIFQYKWSLISQIFKNDWLIPLILDVMFDNSSLFHRKLPWKINLVISTLMR